MSSILNRWMEEQERITDTIDELQRSDSHSVRDLLVALTADADVQRSPHAHATPAFDETLDDLAVNELLADDAGVRNLLGELESMRVSAGHWESVLTRLRDAVAIYLQEGGDASAELHWSDHGELRAPLCEAEDKYWYL